MRRARFCFASAEIWNTFSRQLKAISMMSLFKSKCCDFSFVKITMNDFMIESRSYDYLTEQVSLYSMSTETLPVFMARSVGEPSPKMRRCEVDIADWL